MYQQLHERGERQHNYHPKGRDFWGPPMWRALHSMAAAYTPNHKEAALTFVYICLPNLLPCEVCREHLKKNLTEFPPDRYMADNHTFFFWTYALHDIVNQQVSSSLPIDRKKISPPFEVVKTEYFSALSSDCSVCRLP